MIKTRHNVFETNSSSSHSLTLVKGDLMPVPFSKEILRSGVVNIAVSEYGWDWYRYYLPLSKLSYLLTQVTGGNINGRSLDQLAQEYPTIERMARVVKDHTGCQLCVINSSGYIDHDSVGVGMEMLASDDALREFLFTAASYIETGNDNESAPWEIPTDLGSDLYYEQFMVDVPEDYVLVGAYSGSEYGFSSICLKTGGYLAEESHPELLAEFEKTCILVNTTVVRPSVKPQHYSDYEDAGDRRASSLSRVHSVFENDECRVVRDFKVDVANNVPHLGMTNYGEYEMLLCNFAIPKDLALKLQALPVTESVQNWLDEAQAMLKQANAALKKEPTHHYFARRRDSATKAIAGYKKQLAALKKAAA